MGLSSRGASYGRALSEEVISAVGNVTAEGLTAPASARSAVVSVDADARYKQIGTPTVSEGHYLVAGNQVEVFADELDTFEIIAATGTAVDVFVTYYGD